MTPSLTSQLSQWVVATSFGDLPDDIVTTTRLRVLDVLGLALAGLETDFGRAIVGAARATAGQGAGRLVGTGDRVGMMAAAFVNGSLPQALEFDDTHNESIVHMSSPAVSAALALAEARPVSGRDLILAVALGNEVSCRVGSVVTGQFHARGFHPTGLFAPFGIALLAGKLLGLDATRLANAAGIVGSFAAGLLECWVDGTQAKFLHSGWAAQSGIMAALLAASGTTGPAAVLEGRFGLFASHLQDPEVPKRFERVTQGLGERWDSRNASFKPYPAAHVLHPYIEAIIRLRERHGIAPGDVARIDCPVAAFIVPIVCEPAAEKCAPSSDSHGRVSLQYTLAEALAEGSLGRHAYGEGRRGDPEVLALARRVHYQVDPTFPGPGRFKGVTQVTLNDGRVLTETQEYNRGSPENPMTGAELRAKFDDNASGILSEAERAHLAERILAMERLPDAGALVDAAIAARFRGTGADDWQDG